MEDYAVERSGGDSLSIEDFDEEQCRVSLGAEISRSFTLENGTALKPKVGGTAAYSSFDGSGAFGTACFSTSKATAAIRGRKRF